MKWFNNLKLGKKIMILSTSLIVSLIIIGISGLIMLHNSHETIKTLNNDRLIPIYDLEVARSQLKDIRLAVRSHLTADTKEDKQKYEKVITDSENNMLEKINKFSKTNLVKEESELLGRLRKSYDEYKAERLKVLSLSHDGKYEEAEDKSDGEARIKYEQVNADFQALINIQITVAKKLYSDNEIMYKAAIFSLTALMAICLIFGIMLSIITTRGIVIPVKNVSYKLREIARSGGDLTQRIGNKSKNEIGQLSRAFDEFMDKLQKIIGDVTESAQVIASSSQQLSAASSESNKAMEQIAHTVNSIASSTSDNVAVTEETTANLSEAAKFSEATAAASKKTNYNSINVKEAAEQGSVKVNDIVVTINGIARSSSEVEVLINELDDSSRRIGEIVQLITNISEQTNLLALNAAIEAARAGEAGRGFNVVADEIRKLADESNSAAKEIVTLINDNQSKTKNAVQSVKAVDSMVEVAVDKASGVKENIDNIIDNINNIVIQIGSINNDVEKQAVIADEMSKAMNIIAGSANDMAAATEEMSASIEEQTGTMEEIEASAHQLSQMAEKLNNLTSQFKI